MLSAQKLAESMYRQVLLNYLNPFERTHNNCIVLIITLIENVAKQFKRRYLKKICRILYLFESFSCVNPELQVR